MPSKKVGNTPLQVALDEVLRQEHVLATWEAEASAARTELESLQSTAGPALLADPTAGEGLAETMRRLQGRVDMASRAIAAIGPRMTDAIAGVEGTLASARRAAITAEADEWFVEVARLQDLLDAHRAHTRELLDLLEAHDGLDYSLRQSAATAGVLEIYTDGVPRLEGPATSKLALEVERARMHGQVCRDIAEGRDPAPMLQAAASYIDGTVLGLAREAFYPRAMDAAAEQALELLPAGA